MESPLHCNASLLKYLAANKCRCISSESRKWSVYAKVTRTDKDTVLNHFYFFFFFAVLYSTSVRGTLVWRRRRVSVTVLTINLNVLMPKSNTYIGTYGAWWTLMSLACVQNIFNKPIAPATPWAHYTHHIFLSQHCHPLTDTCVMFLYSAPRTVGVFQEWPWEMYVLCK